MFTPEEVSQNRAEGWDLWSYSTDDEHEYYAIQRLDEDPLETFVTDIAAYHFCKVMTEKGSERHARAIALHGDYVIE